VHESRTNGEAQSLTLAELARRARGLVTPNRRRLLGIAGPPGAGKSTLAEAVQAALRPRAAIVPMDGFHLSKAELVELGRLDRMGSPDTFNAQAFVELVSRLRDPRAGVVLAPAFDRQIEAPVPDAIRVSPTHQLAIVEGNYLLLDYEPWSSLREMLDEVWFLELSESERMKRLVARHVAYGKAPDAARAWSLGTDEANATLVSSVRARADLIVSLRD
jgi:pantothenate kinase